MKPLIYILVVAFTGYASGSGVTIGLHPELHPIHSLYHSQDWHGQYTYGYTTPMISRNEVRNMDGTTVGGYSYMDTNGILQTVQYKSDPIHGFQVAASNLPEDLPDVAAAKAKHLALFRTIQESRAAGAVAQVPLPQPVQDLPEVVAARQAHMAALEAARAGVMPQPVQDTPEVARAKAEHMAFFEATRARDEALRRAVSLSPTPQGSSSVVALPNQPSESRNGASAEYRPAADINQYGSNGVYSYGYVSPLSSRTEAKTSDGVTRGGYSYIDANGILQTVRYIADDVNGFRVQATNLLTNPSESQSSNRVQAPQQSPSGGQEAVSSNMGGFIINVNDNSLQNDNVDMLYRHEIQY